MLRVSKRKVKAHVRQLLMISLTLKLSISFQTMLTLEERSCRINVFITSFYDVFEPAIFNELQNGSQVLMIQLMVSRFDPVMSLTLFWE